MSRYPASYYRRLAARHRAGNPPRVPVGPVRAHLLELAEVDVSIAVVAIVADLPRCTIDDALAGKYRTVDATSARRILSATLDRVLHDPIPPSTRVPKAGAVRRIQALLLSGHRHDDLTQRCGHATSRILIDTECRVIARAAHDAVARLHSDLRDVAGPSIRTARRAVKAGYLPLSAWDDVDDPRSAAGPDAVGVLQIQRAARPADDVVAEVLLLSDEPLHVAADRIGMSRHALERTLQRHRPDLLAQLRQASARWRDGAREAS